MKINFRCNKSEFDNDYRDILRAFYPYVELDDEGELIELEILNLDENSFDCFIKRDNSKVFRRLYFDKKFLVNKDSDCYETKLNAQIKRHSKVMLYDYLSDITKVKLPYGSLTGIRPTKLYHETLAKGMDADGYFLNTLKVSKDKLDLIKNI